jgi:hypothetical protein
LYFYTGSGSGEPEVIDPDNYVFLLKSYKMYKKDKNNTNTVDTLSLDEIKELTSSEAQTYFDNTIVHNKDDYKDKLILSDSAAKEILSGNGCGNYFIVSPNVGIQVPSSQQYEYYDLKNFELTYYSSGSGDGMTRNDYKYNTNGKVVKVRQVYDPYTGEYMIMSQNNAGTFTESYNIDRQGVIVRGESGKKDYYYYENTDDGVANAEQLKEDILYAIDEGPSIVIANNLVEIDHTI